MSRRGRKRHDDESMTMPVLLLRPKEAALAMGIGLTKTYELIARGEIPSVKLGNSVRIPLDALRDTLARKTESRHPTAAVVELRR